MVISSYERRLKVFVSSSHAKLRRRVAQGWRCRSGMGTGNGTSWHQESPVPSWDFDFASSKGALLGHSAHSCHLGDRTLQLPYLCIILTHTELKPPPRHELKGNFSIISGCTSPHGFAFFSVGAWLISEDYLQVFLTICCCSQFGCCFWSFSVLLWQI